jgi:EcsC protein family
MKLSDDDRESLRYAKNLLEDPGLAAKITNVIGVPIEKGFELLPEKWAEVVSGATRKSLETALHVAMVTLDDKPQAKSWEILHKLAVAATGAGGGAFGLAGIPVELPLSTTIILRSIADIARSEGERLGAPEAKLACLEVFALGGRNRSDDATESAYFMVRSALAKSVSDAAKHMAEKGLIEQGAPAIVRLVKQLASRFGVNVSEKLAAQAVPAIGAIGGAVINVLFIDHFQDMARGHFIMRRLERAYTIELVRKEYKHLW